AGSSSKPYSKPKRTWNRSALEKERRDFFETRVTGREEVWGSLRLAIGLLNEGDVEDAQGVLDASGVTVPTGDLVDGCYDEQGALYQLPSWVVADPERVVEDGEQMDGREGGRDREDGDEMLEGRDEKEKGKEAVSMGGIKVKCRLSDRGGPDVVILMARDERVGVLIKMVQKEANLLDDTVSHDSNTPPPLSQRTFCNTALDIVLAFGVTILLAVCLYAVLGYSSHNYHQNLNPLPSGLRFSLQTFAPRLIEGFAATINGSIRRAGGSEGADIEDYLWTFDASEDGKKGTGELGRENKIQINEVGDLIRGMILKGLDHGLENSARASNVVD
ncbi:MAG: hypothetical protein Q9170_007268, partial [Blastenia crenularia]